MSVQAEDIQGAVQESFDHLPPARLMKAVDQMDSHY